MPTNSRHRSPSLSRLGVASLLAAAGTAGLSACTGSRSGSALTVSDFRASAVAPEHAQDAPADARAPMIAAAASVGTVAVTEPDVDAPVVTIVPIELEEDARLATSIPAPGGNEGLDDMGGQGPAAQGEPAAPQAGGGVESTPSAMAGFEPDPDADLVPIDALVGHINGQPVYASEMLSGLRAQMNAEAAKGNPRAWYTTISQQIATKLQERIKNELVLAEARESLTPAQRKGLQFILDEIRGTVVREEGGGSALRAEQRLLARQEQTLDEEVEERLDAELIKQELRTKIIPLVQVSYRDVKLRYRRDYEKYHPPTTATFLVIRMPKEPSEAFQQVLTRLASGESFAAVAAEDWNVYPDDGVVERSFRDSLDKQELFYGTMSPVNEAARGLSPGQQTGPIDLGNGDAAWVRLESLETPEPTSLYDAQLEIERELRNEAFAREQMRYIQRLRGEGSYTREGLMAQYLTDFAAEQHLPRKKE